MFSITTDSHSPLIVYSHLSTQLWYVDKLMRMCVLFQIDQKIAVRRGCRIGECLLNERATPGVHLFGQICDLRRISRVLEDHHVLRVQTDGADLLVFWKQIVDEIDDGRVGVVALLREQVRHATVCFGHEIV